MLKVDGGSKMLEERSMVSDNNDDIPVENPHGVDLDQAGIFEITVRGVDGSYIVRSMRLSRGVNRYKNNIHKILNNRAYNESNPHGFREIHKTVKRAINSKHSVTITLLENCDAEDLNQRRRYWKSQRTPLI
jgi:hypothetical protein